MIPTKKILAPTDFSELAEHALHFALDLARAYKAELHVLHVVTPSEATPVAVSGAVGDGAGGLVLLETAEEVASRRAKELTSYVESRCGGLPNPTVTCVRIGAAWQEIARYADEVAVDLIVIGSHARGVMQRILLGSTSKAVLEHVACPVLMAPIAAMERQREMESLDTTSAAGAAPRGVAN